MIKVEDLSKKFSLNKEQRKERNTKDHFAFAVKTSALNVSLEKYFHYRPNGAGKTTTLRMLSLVITPTSGSIIIGGVDAISEPQEARRKIGFLTGSFGLYARLNAHELIDYFASLYDVPNQAVRERKNYLFDLLDMNEFANKKLANLVQV